MKDWGIKGRVKYLRYIILNCKLWYKKSKKKYHNKS